MYGRISELSDPIFRDSEELHPGDTVRLYTRGGDECVGEGCIVEYEQQTWGSTGIFLTPRRATRGLTRRWVVRLSKVLVPLASTLYPEENDATRTQPTAQVGGRVGDNLLWDADRMRKTVRITPPRLQLRVKAAVRMLRLEPRPQREGDRVRLSRVWLDL